MKKTPTFLNLTNKKAAPDREFILHTGHPAFLAEVISFETEAETVEFGKNFMDLCEQNKAPCLGSRSRKPWNGKHFFFAAIAIYEGIEVTEKEADRLARITRRMADWYLYNVLGAKKINGFFPCKICGGQARFNTSTGPHSHGASEDYLFVECMNCGIRTQNVYYCNDKKEKARNMWNEINK